MKTHSFLDRGFGHDVIVNKIEDDGQRIHVTGWCYEISEGDTLVLPNGSGQATYAVEKIRYKLDPRDMFAATLTYLGKPANAEESTDG